MLLSPPAIGLWYRISLRSMTYHHVEAIHCVNGCPSLHANILRAADQCEIEFVHDHRLQVEKRMINVDGERLKGRKKST